MNENWKAEFSTKLICGPDAILSLSKQISGQRLLVCTSKSIVQLDEVKNLLKSAKFDEVKLLKNIAPNPTETEIDKIYKSLVDFSPELVVAIGGGSVIDFAKVLSALFSNQTVDSISELLRVDDYVERICGLVAIPTTAGTGSEVTPFATIWTENSPGKISLDSSTITPDLVVLQGGLLKSCPMDQMLYSGLDAISHCVESLWSKNRTPVSELFASSGLERMLMEFPRVLERGNSDKNFQILQEAAMFAGLAISQTRTAIAHSISYPITSKLGMPHGLACSFTIPAIWREIDEGEKRKLKYSSLINEATGLISSLDLQPKVSRWLSLDSAEILTTEMLNSNRASNFVLATNENMIRNILRCSL